MSPSLVHQTAHLGAINTFLVPHDDGLVLIDAAIRPSAGAILKAAAQLGAGPITTIVLTHAHPDHVGALGPLLRALPGVELVLSEREAAITAGDRSPRPGEAQKPSMRNVSIGKASATRTVSEGDLVGPLEVIAAPGHTPGHIALLDSRDRTLYCGDAFSTIGGVATTGRLHWRFPLPALFTWDKPTELATAAKLITLNPARLAPGHGKVVEQPVGAMERAVAG